MPKKSKTLKMKTGQLNPLLNPILMPILAIFFFISMVLTLPAVASWVGRQLNVDGMEIRFWAKVLSSIAGGILVLLIATAYVAMPYVAIPLTLAGITGIGWGVYKINKDKMRIDVGSGTNSPR